MEGMRDGVDAWRALGVGDPEAVSMMTAGEAMSVASAIAS
jgi:hypothetical protein